jgi:hypothetical protein
MFGQRNLVFMTQDRQPEFVASALRKSDVIEMRVRQHECLQVFWGAAKHSDRVVEQLPRSWHARIDDC